MNSIQVKNNLRRSAMNQQKLETVRERERES